MDIPAAEAVILVITESSAMDRVFYFENLTASAITLTLQESADGGATYTDVTFADASANPFVLGAVGSGTERIFKHYSSLNIFRIQGSGGGDDRDILLTYGRYFPTGDTAYRAPE